MNRLATASFWSDTAERAVKTGAQAALAVLGTDVTGILDVDWTQTGSVVGLAMLLSLLSSIATGRDGSASAIGAGDTTGGDPLAGGVFEPTPVDDPHQPITEPQRPALADDEPGPPEDDDPDDVADVADVR